MTRQAFFGGRVVLVAGALVASVGCGDSDAGGAAGDDGGDAGSGDGGTDDAVSVPDTYAFESSHLPGESSVSYSGQVFRHVLIAEMKGYLGTLTERIDNSEFSASKALPEAGDVKAALEFYFDFDGDVFGEEALTLSTDPPLLQVSWSDISSGTTLAEKIAGNDPVGQHVDWTKGTPGWGDGTTSPEVLVRGWFQEIDDLAVDRANGTIPQDPSGAPVGSVLVTAAGQDLGELLQKFLLGAIAFSQGADDYLDDTPDFDAADDGDERKGLLSDHTMPEKDGAAWSTLEHAWDEGFGYFGAARDYGDYTDDEIADVGYMDSDGDGKIDLKSEYVFGHAQNAGKRDRGAAAEAPTDFSGTAFEAFLTGRAILSAAEGALGDEEMAALKAQRDIAIRNWELAIAATVVHYVNEVLADMQTFGSSDYDFRGHAKHFSELKGFALSLQFNPASPLDDDGFAALHALLRDAPALPGDASADAYVQDLLDARALVGEAYGFDAANLGDERGGNGW